MKTRQIIGLIIFLVGFFLLIIGGFIGGWKSAFFLLIYGVPLIIIGIIIYFNKHEDKIEQINYFKIERRKK